MKLEHKTRSIVFSVLLLAAIFVAAVGVLYRVAPGLKGSTRDWPNRAASTTGMYTLFYRSQVEPIPINRSHEWVLHLEKRGAGLALDNATIWVDGGNALTGAALPSRPEVTRMLGNGNYLLEGMKFSSPGRWTINFHISFRGDIDTVTIQVDLP